MTLLSIFVAGAAAYGFGAIWYMTLAKPWMAAAGVEVGADGKPANRANPVPYIVSLICALIVAGMMRHIFALAGINDALAGATSGLGLGLFIAAPWIATNYTFAARPHALILIDGGYATFGCTLMGLVLGLM